MQTRNQIIEQLYRSKEFNDCISRMEPEQLRDDLKNDVALILLEKDDKVIIDMHERNILKFFTVRIVLNLVKSSTSPFYKKYRQYNLQIAENNAALLMLDDNSHEFPIIGRKNLEKHYSTVHDQEAGDISERIDKEALEDRAMAIMEAMDEYPREIVKIYLKVGSYRKIEKETYIPQFGRGIPWESCYTTIQNAFKQIRHALNNT